MKIDFKEDQLYIDFSDLERMIDFSTLIEQLTMSEKIRIKPDTIESSYWTFSGLLQDVHENPIPKTIREDNRKWNLFISNAMVPLIYHKNLNKLTVGIKGQAEDDKELRHPSDITIRLEDSIFPYLGHNLDIKKDINYLLLTNKQYDSLIRLVRDDELRKKYSDKNRYLIDYIMHWEDRIINLNENEVLP